MTLKQKLLIFLTLLMPMAGQAQSISQAQIDQFRSLPQSQQEALAKQYGVDLNALNDGNGQQQAPQRVDVVKPLNDEASSPSDQSQADQAKRDADRKEAARQKNGGLEPFGYDLFAGRPSTFAPVTEIPVPAEYTLGPGDVLRVQLWGKENQQLTLPISRNGTVDFPQHGPLSVAGLSFQEAGQQIRKLVSEQYIGVQASVSLGELRSMRIFVLGEARSPGAYTVSSLSTMSNALFVSGGVKESGSLRHVQHKRNGKLMGELDLYDLLLNGDTSDDQRLQPGDVIFIPPVGPRVGIEGEVYRPALYELDGETTLGSLVALAGGLTPQAYPQTVRIERTNDEFLRVLVNADLSTKHGQRTRIQAGDRVDVAALSDVTGQYVEVTGAASRPGRYAWMPGMRFSSIISSLEADLDPAADQTAALIVHTDPRTDRVSAEVVDVHKALANQRSAADPQLAERDQILIFADLTKTTLDDRDQLPASDNVGQRDKKREGGQASSGSSREQPMGPLTDEEKTRLRKLQHWQRESLLAPVLARLEAQASPNHPAQTMQVAGAVRFPGQYPIPTSHRVADVVFLAGGLKDSASLLTAELARFGRDASGDGRTTIKSLNLRQGLLALGDISLQSRDRLLIKPTPQFAQRRTITLNGEIRFPGEYTFRDGETLRDVIERAGGLTNNAFPKGAVFTREKLRQLEAERLQEAEKRLQGDLLGVKLKQGNALGKNADQVQQLEGMLNDVQSSRPVGRMVIDLPAVLAGKAYQPIRLQDGDALTVPQIPQAVSVFGEVQFPTSHLYQPGLTVDDYIERSGGLTRQADDSRVYVVKADGSVMVPEQSSWFGGRSQQLAPGDTVIAPIDVDRLNQLELWTNVSQIFYQIGLGAAAVGNL